MDKARIGGVVICLLVIVVAAAFIYGLTLPNWQFWAVAAPVAVGFLGVLALGLWIGWTMASTKIELPPPQEDAEEASETPSEASE